MNAPITSNFHYWFWPTTACTLTAILAMLVRAPEWITEALDMGGHEDFV